MSSSLENGITMRLRRLYTSRSRTVLLEPQPANIIGPPSTHAGSLTIDNKNMIVD